MTFIRNAWYVAAWGRDLDRTLQRRTILGENVVLYRQEDGTPVALHDLCPHRSLPLSMGRLTGDALQCGYHGMTFDATGRCVRVPGQGRIPKNARVRRYPLAENMGLVWIWMGDPARADTSEVFDLPAYHDPGWTFGHGDALPIRAGYLLVTDNLCDPVHVGFVHPTTLGTPGAEDGPVKYKRTKNGVLVTRWTLNDEPIGLFKAFGKFEGKVDRWQIFHMILPSISIIDFGSAETGTGAPEGRRDRSVQGFSCHFLTPATSTTTYDYWMHVRNFATDDESVTEGMTEQLRFTFNEDTAVLEAIQREEERYGTAGRVSLKLDAAPIRFRRMVEERIAEERSALAAE